MIRAILFDLDDTLLDFHRAEAEAVAEALRRMEVEPTPEAVALYSRINAQHWVLLEQGKLTREQVLVGRFRELYAQLGLVRSAETTMEIYEKRLAVGHYFVPGAPELLDQLVQSYALYLVSNGTAVVQDGRIASAGIARYFRDIFISQRMGADKPSPVFFDRCFARMPGISRRETVIVGDSLTSDMQGGRNAGICTCWFNPLGKPYSPDLPVDYQIHRLDQLPALLRQIP